MSGDRDLVARWDGDVPPDGELRGPIGDPWSDCPIVPLGHCDGVFIVLDVVGQLRRLTARQLLHRGDHVSLYLGDETFLVEHWPRIVQRRGADGRIEAIIVGFYIGPAASWIMQVCRDAGIWGPHMVIRQAGIWPADLGAVVVHCGDGVMIWRAGEQPQPMRCGRIGDAVYPASARRLRPTVPCGPEIAQNLQQDIQVLWNFRQGGGAIAFLGLIANGYLGAVPGWRPNGFVLGPTAAGKSQLIEIARAAWPLHNYTTDTTKSSYMRHANRVVTDQTYFSSVLRRIAELRRDQTDEETPHTFSEFVD